MGSFLFEAHGQLELERSDTVLKDTTAGQIITDMRVRTRSPLVEGWSFRLLHHSASPNAISRERFKKDFVDLCISAHLDVGPVFMCAEIRLQQCSPRSFFLHVCSTCSSHISANIYTGCKTLLISLPCLLSCSFSRPTHTDLFSSWLRVTGGRGQRVRGGGGGGGGAEREQVSVEWGQGEQRGSKEKAFGGEREKWARERSTWWMTCQLIEIKSPICQAHF